MPDGRLSPTLLAPIRPQRMMSQNEGEIVYETADLVPFPDYRNMLVLSSRANVPGPFPTSFKTGTTLPPPADPSLMTDELYEEARLFGAIEMQNQDNKSLASSLSPLQTTLPDEHVVLL